MKNTTQAKYRNPAEPIFSKAPAWENGECVIFLSCRTFLYELVLKLVFPVLKMKSIDVMEKMYGIHNNVPTGCIEKKVK